MEQKPLKSTQRRRNMFIPVVVKNKVTGDNIGLEMVMVTASPREDFAVFTTEEKVFTVTAKDLFNEIESGLTLNGEFNSFYFDSSNLHGLREAFCNDQVV